MFSSVNIAGGGFGLQFAGWLLRFFAALATAILAPILLVLAGGLLAGAGLYLDWMWLIYAGVIVGAIGVFFILRLWE